MNSADHLSGCLKEGGGFVGIMKMACNPTCHEISIFGKFSDNQVKHTYHWTIIMDSYMKMACNPTCHEISIFGKFSDNQVKHTYHWTIIMDSYMKMACNPTFHEISIFDNFTDYQVKHTYHWTRIMDSYTGYCGGGGGGGGGTILLMSCYKQVCTWIKRKKMEKRQPMSSHPESQH